MQKNESLIAGQTGPRAAKQEAPSTGKECLVCDHIGTCAYLNTSPDDTQLQNQPRRRGTMTDHTGCGTSLDARTVRVPPVYVQDLLRRGDKVIPVYYLE